MSKPNITPTDHRILVALRGDRDMAMHQIAIAAGLGNGVVLKSLPRLELVGLIKARKHTPMYRLTDAGLAASQEPCPGTTPPPEPTPEPPREVHAGPSEGRLTPGEHAVLQYLAAHPGLTLAEAAAGMGRSPGTCRDFCNRLSFRGLLRMPDGVGTCRVPVVTDDGHRRAKEPVQVPPNPSRLPLSGGPRVTETGMKILRALLVADGPMSHMKLASVVNLTHKRLRQAIEPLVSDGHVCIGTPTPRVAEPISLTDKGRRMANGDLVSTTPRLPPPPASILRPAAPVPVVVDLDNLVPPALRTRRGIVHPPLPKPAERPRGMTASAWHGATSPNWSVGGAL